MITKDMCTRTLDKLFALKRKSNTTKVGNFFYTVMPSFNENQAYADEHLHPYAVALPKTGIRLRN